MNTEKVLVVEDDKDVRKVILKLLRAPGRELMAAADGGAGLKTALASRPDVIILDLRLPDMDGLAVCRALRKDPATRGARVMILTGEADLETEDAARANGADAFLAKPFGLEQLESRVNALITGRPS